MTELFKLVRFLKKKFLLLKMQPIIIFAFIIWCATARLVMFDFEEPKDVSEKEIEQRMARSTSKWVNFLG